MSLKDKLDQYMRQRTDTGEVFGADTLRQARLNLMEIVGDDGGTDFTPEFVESVKDMDMPWRLYAMTLRHYPSLRQDLREWLWDTTSPEDREKLGWEKWW